MPRSLLNLDQTHKQQSTSVLSLAPKAQPQSNLSALQIDRLLNRKRSTRYMDAMTRLDAGGCTHNQHKTDAVIEAIREEMPEITIDLGPLGIVSKCYLGDPYEVHTVDMTGMIIEHYKSFQSLPPMLEKARTLAKNDNYAFIEVYADCIRAVKGDGTVVAIKE